MPRTRAWLALLLLAILALPGALAGPTPAGTGGHFTQTGEGTYDAKGEFQLLVRHARAGPIHRGFAGSYSGFCVTLEGDDPGVRVLGGHATLRWTAESPLAKRLALTYTHGGHVLRVEGTSPLGMTLPEESAATSMAQFSISSAGRPGAALDQKAMLTVGMSFEGPSRFSFGNAEPCAPAR